MTGASTTADHGSPCLSTGGDSGNAVLKAPCALLALLKAFRSSEFEQASAASPRACVDCGTGTAEPLLSSQDWEGMGLLCDHCATQPPHTVVSPEMQDGSPRLGHLCGETSPHPQHPLPTRPHWSLSEERAVCTPIKATTIHHAAPEPPHS